MPASFNGWVRRECLVSLLLALVWVGTGCEPQSAPASGSTSAPVVSNVSPAKATTSVSQAVAQPKPASLDVPVYTYEIVRVLPHDTTAFTQGLVFLNGEFVESAGLVGESSLRRVEVDTGRVVKQVVIPPPYFAEGMVVMGRRVYQLTWQHQKGFIYDLETFEKLGEFSYEGEGWGLTTDGESLIMSDGTDQIRYLNPDNFAVRRRIQVRHRNRPVVRLNELEFIRGEIFANVWGTDFVVRIDPESGRTTGVIDFTGLLPAADRSVTTDVLIGIAHDSKGDRLFVTGKKWPKLFEIRLRVK